MNRHKRLTKAERAAREILIQAHMKRVQSSGKLPKRYAQDEAGGWILRSDIRLPKDISQADYHRFRMHAWDWAWVTADKTVAPYWWKLGRAIAKSAQAVESMDKLRQFSRTKYTFNGQVKEKANGHK